MGVISSVPIDEFGRRIAEANPIRLPEKLKVSPSARELGAVIMPEPSRGRQPAGRRERRAAQRRARRR